MSGSLFRRQWSPHNREKLLSFGKRERSTEATAAFDWDNTCIFGDVGDTSFRYLLQHGPLVWSLDALDALLPRCVNGHTKTSEGTSLSAFADDILESYRALLKEEAIGQTAQSARTRKPDKFIDKAAELTDARRDFSTKVYALYCALSATPDIGAAVSYPFQVLFFAGLKASALPILVHRALDAAQKTTATQETLATATAGLSGHHLVPVDPRIRRLDEIADLLSFLTQSGVVPYVVTASFEPIVEACAKYFQYPVPQTHILGMRLTPDNSKKAYLPKLKSDWPVTYREGKVACIKRVLPEGPALVAGDHITDYEMLTEFKETQVRLVIDRDSKLPEMMALYAMAKADQHRGARHASDGPITLLQKRDVATGTFCAE